MRHSTASARRPACAARTARVCVTAVACAAALAGCGSGPATRPAVAGQVRAEALPSLPAQWHSPLPTPPAPTTALPHSGDVASLARWWQRFDDPVLGALIEAAQAASPTVASAASRIEQSRAARVSASAALLPSLDASASASRGRNDRVNGAATSANAGVQLAWEADVFGGRRAARDAAQARLEGSQLAWHDARVSVAAEAASGHIALRACEAQLEQARADSHSRNETARLTGLSTRAGFESPANAALARASAAQGNSVATQRRAQCDTLVKGLVALTAIDESMLRLRLAPGAAQAPNPAALRPGAVPAEALAQRPDLLSAELDVVAASADVTQAEAARLPRIGLSGNLGVARLDAGGFDSSGSVWSIGPVTVSLPLFDGGARRANVAASQARYDEAVAVYRAKLRQAVREIEEPLVALQSTADRQADAQVASDGFAASLRATEARFKGGLGSLFELEDARRSAVAAQIALIDLQRERASAWVQLYRALGGGWSASDAAVANPVTVSR